MPPAECRTETAENEGCRCDLQPCYNQTLCSTSNHSDSEPQNLYYRDESNKDIYLVLIVYFLLCIHGVIDIFVIYQVKKLFGIEWDRLEVWSAEEESAGVGIESMLHGPFR